MTPAVLLIATVLCWAPDVEAPSPIRQTQELEQTIDALQRERDAMLTLIERLTARLTGLEAILGGVAPQPEFIERDNVPGGRPVIASQMQPAIPPSGYNPDDYYYVRIKTGRTVQYVLRKRE